MAKSHITSGKKAREKKKQSQRKDKLERKEERKANNNKGKSFEDMLAYVDENGRLSSTPPDPSKKKSIMASEIQVSVPRQTAVEPPTGIRSGMVTFFNHSRGFGFIRDTDSNESIFVHINELKDPVNENDKVTFEIEKGHKGLVAVNVKITAG